MTQIASRIDEPLILDDTHSKARPRELEGNIVTLCENKVAVPALETQICTKIHQAHWI